MLLIMVMMSGTTTLGTVMAVYVNRLTMVSSSPKKPSRKRKVAAAVESESEEEYEEVHSQPIVRSV